MTVKFHWSNSVKITTAFTLLLPIILPLVVLCIDGMWDKSVAMAVFLSVFPGAAIIIGICAYWCIGMMPLSISVNAGKIGEITAKGDKNTGEIVVKQGRGKSMSIPLESIISIEPVEAGCIRKSVRTFGSGGMFGHLGQFHNKEFGNFEMYATELKDLIAIKTVKKTYVFSCMERDAFISKISMLLRKCQ